MNEPEEANIKELLKRSLPPMNADLPRDLWPRMQRRLQERERTWLAALFSPARLSAVPWFDWALLAALIVGVCLFPRSIPIWLYHL